MPHRKRILIADDHGIVRVGLRRILEERKDILVVAEAATADQALSIIRSEQLDLVILDISLGESYGLDVLRLVHQERPSVPVLILSMHSEDEYALRCLRAGAAGYLTKSSAPEELLNAIDRTLSGRRYVSPEVAEQLATQIIGGDDETPHLKLSNREYQVFQLLVSGKTVTEIGKMLSLSVKTVSTHRTHILEKMSMRTNADLIRYAIEHSLQ